MEAKGTFQVKISPAETGGIESEAALGRMTIDKAWSGDLQGISKGAMLTCATESTGSMAYVALERVDASLNGRTGIFYFSHNAVMNKNDAAIGWLNIRVVPGSGTGELSGISGELTINRDNGIHSYLFTYQLQD